MYELENFEIDFGNDGNAEITLIDSDGNGWYDQIVFDFDSDGVADLGFTGLDGNSEFGIMFNDGSDGSEDTSVIDHDYPGDNDGDDPAADMSLHTEGDDTDDSNDWFHHDNGDDTDDSQDWLHHDNGGDDDDSNNWFHPDPDNGGNNGGDDNDPNHDLFHNGGEDEVTHDGNVDGPMVKVMEQNVHLEDIDGNGRGDIYSEMIDTDGDGIADTEVAYIDTDQDGHVDKIVTGTDADHDGHFEHLTFAYDYDQDGVADIYEEYTDVNDDGSFDVVSKYFDTTGDGFLDRIEQYVDMNGDGVEDGYYLSQFIDSDNDGEFDTFINAVDENGDGVYEAIGIFDYSDDTGDIDVANLITNEDNDLTYRGPYAHHEYEWADKYDPDDSDPSKVIGDPERAMENWEYQGNTGRCAVYAQKFAIEEYLGRDIPIDEFVNIAKEEGFFTEDGGTQPVNMDKMLEYYNIPHEMTFGNDASDLEQALMDGDRVIVSLDMDEVWNNEHNADMFSPLEDGANHAVEVAGIDYSDPNCPMVILNDSGSPEGCGELVPLDLFLDAWEDGNCQMIVVDMP